MKLADIRKFANVVYPGLTPELAEERRSLRDEIQRMRDCIKALQPITSRVQYDISRLRELNVIEKNEAKDRFIADLQLLSKKYKTGIQANLKAKTLKVPLPDFELSDGSQTAKFSGLSAFYMPLARFFAVRDPKRVPAHPYSHGSDGVVICDSTRITAPLDAGRLVDAHEELLRQLTTYKPNWISFPLEQFIPFACKCGKGGSRRRCLVEEDSGIETGYCCTKCAVECPSCNETWGEDVIEDDHCPNCLKTCGHCSSKTGDFMFSVEANEYYCGFCATYCGRCGRVGHRWDGHDMHIAIQSSGVKRFYCSNCHPLKTRFVTEAAKIDFEHPGIKGVSVHDLSPNDVAEIFLQGALRDNPAVLPESLV